MDPEEAEGKISDSERGVRGTRPGPSVLRHGKAQILKILRFVGAFHVDGPGSSELVGLLSRVWPADVWTRTVHGHPDSDSSRMRQNHPGAVLRVAFSDRRFHFQYR